MQQGPCKHNRLRTEGQISLCMYKLYPSLPLMSVVSAEWKSDCPHVPGTLCLMIVVTRFLFSVCIYSASKAKVLLTPKRVITHLFDCTSAKIVHTNASLS